MQTALPLILIVILVFIGIGTISLNVISTRLKKLEDEAERHDNIQKVILEQIDKIAINVGV